MELGPREIQAIIPHRWPFLLVDKIVELEGKRAVGIKQVSSGEIYFQGHFPDYPIMPGVLIVEALAQVGAVALLGDRNALAAALSRDVWVAYPLTPAPGQAWVPIAWVVLSLIGTGVQLGITGGERGRVGRRKKK